MFPGYSFGQYNRIALATWMITNESSTRKALAIQGCKHSELTWLYFSMLYQFFCMFTGKLEWVQTHAQKRDVLIQKFCSQCFLISCLHYASPLKYLFHGFVSAAVHSVRKSWGFKMKKYSLGWKTDNFLEWVQNQEDNGWVRRICWTWSQTLKISWQEVHFSSATANFSI